MQVCISATSDENGIPQWLRIFSWNGTGSISSTFIKPWPKIEEAASAMKQIAKSGKKILFVATKKQAKEIVAEQVKRVNMPYVTERWPGGMLTNFATIRKAVRKMASIDKHDEQALHSLNMSKKERLNLTRERAKLEKNLGSIADLSRLPAAIFIVDILKEHIALAEARKLNIPTFAIVDTNSDPRLVDFPIPANDDASKSILLIVEIMVKAIEEGLMERKLDRDKKDEEAEGGDDIEARLSMDDTEEFEEEEEEGDGIAIVKKDFVDTKVTKIAQAGTRRSRQEQAAAEADQQTRRQVKEVNKTD